MPGVPAVRQIPAPAARADQPIRTTAIIVADMGFPAPQTAPERP
jgi:hypothetical protein